MDFYKKMLKWYFNFKLLLNPKFRKSFCKVKKYFREIDGSKKEELSKYLSLHFFISFKDGYLNSDIGKKDLEDQMINRLLSFRHHAIPWINSIVSLKGSKVLEIGCGTGSTAVALAEQGCNLTSIDIAEAHIKVAKKRCELYDLQVNISLMNAMDINKINEKFDLIIFSASLEHMTYEERLASIKSAWNILNKNGFLVIIETPNRLYYFDEHSSRLPFYHWLPDQIAVQYSKYSLRELFVSNSCDEISLIRFGRGVSFHEFELALNIRCSDFEVYSMQPFEKTFISNIVFDEFKYSKFLKKTWSSKYIGGFLL